MAASGPIGPQAREPVGGSGADEIVARFAAALRAGGLRVPTSSAVLLAQALAVVGLGDPERVYWAGRATLVRRPEDIPVYERVFSAFWARVATLKLAPATHIPLTIAMDSDDEGDGDPGEPDDQIDDEGDVRAVRYSAVEVLSERDLGTLDADEWAEARRLIAAMRVSAEARPSRRTVTSRRRHGDRPDLRATFRRNMRRGGVPVELAWRESTERPRRMVFLLDVSGSMAPYARGLALFAHAAVKSRRSGQVEVFAIGTRLTRITRELDRRDPEGALAEVAASVSDWAGGTRLGDSIGEFNDRWAIRGMGRGAIVVICSDGWDRGDPEVMATEMARLARVARRIVWVNPLKASPGYAPLARGMAAALPYVDQFVEGHSVSSLEQLAKLVGAPSRPGRAGMREVAVVSEVAG